MVDYTKVAVDAAKREMYGTQTAAADAARRGINGAIRDGVQVAREGLKRLIDGAGSLFSGGKGDEIKERIGAAVAAGATVVATAGTALGGAKTAAETAVGQVADAAQSFAADAATVTAPNTTKANPPPSNERTVSVEEFSAVPAKGGIITGVATDVSPKSDFNYAAPGAPLPALEATIEAGGGKFDQATYERARAQIAGIKPPGMG